MDEGQTVTLKLNVRQVNTILLALGKQPLEAVIEVFSVIREQADQQMRPAPLAVVGGQDAPTAAE